MSFSLSVHTNLIIATSISAVTQKTERNQSTHCIFYNEKL